jgi:hypothetical protein
VDQNHTQERKKGVFPSTQCQPNFNFHYELMGSKKIGEGQHSIFPFQASLLHLHDIFHVVIWDLSNSMRLFYMAGWLASKQHMCVWMTQHGKKEHGKVIGSLD